MIIEKIAVGEMQVNCYILAEGVGREAVIIDPGAEDDLIKKRLQKFNLKPVFIINTHGHFDHIGCDDKFGVPVYVHKDDVALLKDSTLNLSGFFYDSITVNSQIIGLDDKQVLELNSLSLGIMHIPGHSPGGIAIVLNKPESGFVFSGDALFNGSVGRTDFPGADGNLLVKSIKSKLFHLPDSTVVLPGHGPSTTIGRERINNPFLA